MSARLPQKAHAALGRPLAGLRRQYRRNFFLDFAGAGLVGVFVAITAAFIPVVARRLGATDLMMSIVMAAPFVGNFLTPFAIYAAQRLPRRPFMVWCWIISRGIFLCMAFVTGPVLYLGLLLVFYILAALPVPAYIDAMRQIYPDDFRGRAMAYVRTGMTVVMTLLTPLAGWLLDLVGYQLLFPVAALFGVASALTFGRIAFDDRPAARRESLSSIWSILRTDRGFALYSLAFTIFGFGNLMITPLIPILQVDELGLSYAEVGFLGLVNSAFWLLGYLYWGRVVDRRGAIWTTKATFLLMLPIPPILFLARDLAQMIPAYILLGFTTASGDLAWLNAMLVFAGRDRVGAYTALHTNLLGIRGMIAPFVGTWLIGVPFVGLRGAFLLAALLLGLGSLLIVYVRKDEGRRAGDG